MTLLPGERYAGDRENQYARLKRLRDAWIQEHGPCASCGSSDNLEIDHIDPSTKDPDLAVRNMWYWNKERRETELAKCQVLCESCHKVKTRADWRTRVTSCPQGHEYTPENTLTHPGRPTISECRICKNAYNAQLRARKRWARRIHKEPRFVEFS